MEIQMLIAGTGTFMLGMLTVLVSYKIMNLPVLFSGSLTCLIGVGLFADGWNQQ